MSACALSCGATALPDMTRLSTGHITSSAYSGAGSVQNCGCCASRWSCVQCHPNICLARQQAVLPPAWLGMPFSAHLAAEQDHEEAACCRLLCCAASEHACLVMARVWRARRLSGQPLLLTAWAESCQPTSFQQLVERPERHERGGMAPDARLSVRTSRRCLSCRHEVPITLCNCRRPEQAEPFEESRGEVRKSSKHSE